MRPAASLSLRASPLPASLRSLRAWATTEQSVHSRSSPQDIDLPRLMMTRDEIGRAFQAEVEAALRRILGRGEAGHGAAYLLRLSPAERARSVELLAAGVRIVPEPDAGTRKHQAYRVVEDNGDRVQAALEAVYGDGTSGVRPTMRVLRQAVAEAYRAVWRQIDQYTAGRAESVWRTTERRRSLPGPLSKRQKMLVAEGRRKEGVLGVDPRFPYEMPADLKRWLARLGVRYDPELNPRRRRRVARGMRARWAFGYDFGLPKQIAALILESMNRAGMGPKARAALPPGERARLPPAVSPKRGWDLLLPELLVCQGPANVGAEEREERVQAATTVLRKLVRLAARKQRPVACYAALFGHRTNHGNAAILDMADGAAVLHLIDPHAKSVVGAHILRDLHAALQRAVDAEADILVRPVVSVKVQPYKPSSAAKARALRIQYSIEGACGPSSLAVLLSALRSMRSGRRRPHPEAILRGVRDQDMVLAIQLTQKV